MYTIVTQSSGRINIIGEHTDYNDGLVLPAAIDRNTTFKLRKNSTDTIVNIQSTNLNSSLQFDLKNFRPKEKGWENYVMGVVNELQKIGANLRGFDGAFAGTIPIGGGMSSSAALTCSLAYGLNELFNLGLDKWQLIKASQMAEHHFVGTKCGIMDQFASMLGKENQVMLLDCRSLEYEYYLLDLQDYELLLLHTNVSHSLADSAYNRRRQECLDGVRILQKKYSEIKSLRDVSIAQLISLQNDMPDLIFNRCKHVVSENQRVKSAVQSLLNKDFAQLGSLMYQSHNSLQNDYEVSCPELDFLVAQTIQNEFVLGSRMMGGGFGGCTLNIIKKAKSERFIEEVSEHYHKRFGLQLTPYSVKIADGTFLVNSDA